MGKFTEIPQDTFDGLQLDVGVLLSKFDPAHPERSQNEDIVCATTGGIKVDCIPSYSDLGEDVDNCPTNMKELKHLDSWDCKVSTTSLGTSKECIRLSLGAADINAETGAIVPRKDLKQSDFTDLWWVGDRADGGLVAVQVKNALSTGGFSLQTTKNGKGQITIELTGHVSMNAQNVMPMVFYSQDPSEATAFNVRQMLSHVESSNTNTVVDAEAEFETTITAETGYTIASVIVIMGGEDVTSDVYTSATGEISIASVTGEVIITATATES